MQRDKCIELATERVVLALWAQFGKAPKRQRFVPDRRALWATLEDAAAYHDWPLTIDMGDEAINNALRQWWRGHGTGAEHVYELKLSNGDVRTWVGRDGPDAARRLVGQERSAVVVAWRESQEGDIIEGPVAIFG